MLAKGIILAGLNGKGLPQAVGQLVVEALSESSFARIIVYTNGYSAWSPRMASAIRTQIRKCH
jgi:hypothetical protein